MERNVLFLKLSRPFSSTWKEEWNLQLVSNTGNMKDLKGSGNRVDLVGHRVVASKISGRRLLESWRTVSRCRFIESTERTHATRLPPHVIQATHAVHGYAGSPYALNAECLGTAFRPCLPDGSCVIFHQICTSKHTTVWIIIVRG